MGFIALKCPNCNGTIQIDENLKQGFCTYCGTKIVNEQAMPQSVNIDRTAEIKGNLEIGKLALETADFAKADTYAEKALLIDSLCSDAWFVKARAAEDPTVRSSCERKARGPGAVGYGVFTEEDYVQNTGYTVSVFLSKMGGSMGNITQTVAVDGRTLDTVFGAKETAEFRVGKGRHTVVVSYNCRATLGTVIIGTAEIDVQSNLRLKTKWSFTNRLSLVPY